MEFIYTAIGLFALAAGIGLYLLARVLQKKTIPKGAAILHGLIASTALVLLIIDMIRSGADTVQIVVLFIITALGGAVLLPGILQENHCRDPWHWCMEHWLLQGLFSCSFIRECPKKKSDLH